MRRTSILLHTLPDGSSHFDWMIDQPELAQDRRLISWRCTTRPDSPDLLPFCGFRLRDHRVRYLSYQGPVTADRGSVEQVGSGTVTRFFQTPDSMGFTIEWEKDAIAYHAKRDLVSLDRWQFEPHKPGSPLDG